MAGPPTSTEATLACHFSGTAVPSGAVVTIGFQHSADSIGSPTLAQLAPLLRTLHDKMATNECWLNTIEMKVGPVATGPTYTNSGSTPGAASPNAVPPNTTVLVRKELVEVSSRFAGRLFWPGMPENMVDASGHIAQTQVTQMQNAFNDLFTGMTAVGCDPAVFGSSDALLQKVNLVDRFVVQTTVATQRRRLRR